MTEPAGPVIRCSPVDHGEVGVPALPGRLPCLWLGGGLGRLGAPTGAIRVVIMAKKPHLLSEKSSDFTLASDRKKE